MGLSASTLAMVALASTAAMLVKSVTGMGYPLVAIPLIAAASNVENAVVAVSLPNLVANVLLVWRARHARGETRDLFSLSVTAALGAAAGTIILLRVPEGPLLWVLAGTLLFFVVRSLRFSHYRIPPDAARRASPAIGLFAGILQGAVGVSGPVVASWLYAYRLGRDAFILSLGVLFLIAGSAQISALAAAGAYDRERLAAATACLGPVLAVMPLGERLRARLSGAAFDRAVLAVLAVGALGLAARAAGS